MHIQVYVFLITEFYNWCFNHIPQRMEVSYWSGSPHGDSVPLWLKGEVASVIVCFLKGLQAFGFTH